MTHKSSHIIISAAPQSDVDNLSDKGKKKLDKILRKANKAAKILK